MPYILRPLKITLPGQGSKLHVFVSTDAWSSPQTEPSGSQVLFLLVMPSPQVTEHWPQLLQSAQAFMAGKGKKNEALVFLLILLC